MGLSWSDAALVQVAGGAIRLGVFFRLDASVGPVRAWGGVGLFQYGGDNVEPDAGAEWSGFGELEGIPALEATINGEATCVEFRLSGSWISATLAQLATWQAFAIRGAFVNLGVMVFDEDWQPLSPMAWIWAGTADSLTVDRQGSREEPTRGIAVSVGSVMTGRRRPNPETWTDANIRALSATDSFGMYVADYNAGTTRVWPNF